MAVEEDWGRGDVLQEGQAGGELVDDEGGGPEGGEGAGNPDVEEQVDVAEDGAQDGEAVEDGGGDEPAAVDTNVEGSYTIIVNDWKDWRGEGETVPSRHSSKQWFRSQWFVKMTTRCPRFCKPTAASTTRRSAPPIPRSGWKKTIVPCSLSSPSFAIVKGPGGVVCWRVGVRDKRGWIVGENRSCKVRAFEVGQSWRLKRA